MAVAPVKMLRLLILPQLTEELGLAAAAEQVIFACSATIYIIVFWLLVAAAVQDDIQKIMPVLVAVM